MALREQYEEHSERDFLPTPLATYHFETVVVPLHWHREVEWMYTQKAGLIEIEGQNYQYEPGDVVCVNRELLHRTTQENPVLLADLLVLDLNILVSPLLGQERGLFLNRLNEGSLLFPLRLGKEASGHSETVRAFEKCVALIRAKEPGWEFSLERELLTMLEAYWQNGHLLETKTFPSNAQTQAVKESIAFMRRSLGQDLTLRQLADQAALSPSHYIRVFRRYTGQTPFAFLNDLRIEEAARCLRQAMTVSETAQRVGVPNLSYFIRLFREKYGKTPKQYQLEQTGERDRDI
ncbi:putative uncharacterized protein [Clostridium sp. CAG:1013]|nr:putative uncharacterized protein [Clostridium sp. CAG:1013]